MTIATPTGLSTRYRKLLPRLPIFVALTFACYSLALFAYSYLSAQGMKAETNTFLVADNQRRATALADLTAEILNEAEQHADLHEIRAYLANRDLGMSERYGLNSSLQAIEDRFSQHAQHRWSSNPSRILFLDANGERLGDSMPTMPLPALKSFAAPVTRLDINAESGQIAALAPVMHKGTITGTVITINTTQVLYRNMMPSSVTSNYRELLLARDGRELPGGGAQPIGAGWLAAFAQAPVSTLLPTAELGAKGTTEVMGDQTEITNALMVKAPVPGSSLHLVTLIPAKRAYGHLASSGLLVSAGLVPILLLLGAIWLDRLRLTADKLQAEVNAAQLRRLATEQRNIELAEEIRQRETLEQALAESEQRWALAVNGTNDGIWDWNIKSGALFLSERWKSMLGYATANDFSGRLTDWKSLLHPDDTERVMNELKQHFDGANEFYEVDFRLRCKDGAYKWIRARGKAMFNAAGKPLRMAGSHTDISASRVAEARLRDRTEQLNAIFALSPDGFVSFDGARRIKYANPAFLRMTGLTESEVLCRDEEAFSALLASICLPQPNFPDVAKLQAAMKVGADGTAAAADQSGLEGQRHLIELTGPGKRVLQVGLRQSQTETVAQILYFRDVTHETEVDRMKSEFLSTAAHELRTPMASVLGFSEVLLAQEFSDEERRDFLSTIHRNAELMANIINELLDLARIESRRGKDFKFATLEACTLAHDITAAFKPPGERQPPVFSTCTFPCPVRVDRDKLTQAINNVLSNAYKYSPAGGPVEITLIEATLTDAAQARLGIRVADHGIGMTPEQLARVCERFYRADSSGKIPGTGLGMSIVREIISLHGGELEIDSKVGAGTTVTLWLPAATAATFL